jgi:Uma2 family endonuclease
MITSIEQLNPDEVYSYTDYITWQLEERVELFKGYFRQMAAPNRKHQAISVYLTSAFFNTFKRHDCKVFAAPFDVCLPKVNSKSKEEKDIYTVLQPDICVICELTKLNEAGCVGSPDLIVEILSPSNSKIDIFDKFQIYEEAGVKEYWIANPTEKYIQQFILNANQKYEQLYVAASGETLTAHIFPELTVLIDEVFED